MTCFVGIDIAKFKHDCFIADENGRVVRDSFSFKNDKDGFQVLLSILKSLKPKGQIKIGFESTGHYHFNLKLFLEANGFDYVEFNPLLVHKFVAGQTLRRTKTDKDPQCIYIITSPIDGWYNLLNCMKGVIVNLVLIITKLIIREIYG